MGRLRLHFVHADQQTSAETTLSCLGLGGLVGRSHTLSKYQLKGLSLWSGKCQYTKCNAWSWRRAGARAAVMNSPDCCPDPCSSCKGTWSQGWWFYLGKAAYEC